MSAREDATDRPRRARAPAGAWSVLALGALAGAALAIAAVSPPLGRARVHAATDVAREAVGARLALRHALVSAVPTGPQPAQTPDADAAAWLLAAVRVLAPGGDASRAFASPFTPAPAPWAPAFADLRSSDPGRTRQTLVSLVRASDGAPSTQRTELAGGLARLAERRLEGQTAFQHVLASTIARARAVELADARGPAGVGRPATGVPVEREQNSARNAGAIGAIAGALAAGLARRVVRSGRRERSRARIDSRAGHARDACEREPRRVAAPRASWLHVVTGPSGARTVRAALSLAAPVVAEGGRVVLVDASPRLRLARRLGREARWGLVDGMRSGLRVVDLVQYAGHPRLHVLAFGEGGSPPRWNGVGQRLDELRPHFDRVVLLLDPGVPRSLGDDLAGRILEGWWAGTGSGRSGRPDDLTARLGIAWNAMSLPEPTEDSLEAFGRLVAAYESLRDPTDPAPVTALARVEVPKAPPVVEAPVVLDCDLQVRERLRFLAWMRRVQAESRREVAQASS